MSDEHRAASREHWSTAASGWAAEASEREAGPAGRGADWMLRAAAPRPGERVLELACGAGDVGLRAAEAVGPEGRVLCSDFAEPMVGLVRERAAAAGLDHVEARLVDAEDPQLGGERFDVVLCRLGYMLLPDPARGLAASRDALAPGGRLALAVWATAERNPWLSLLTDAIMAAVGAPPPPPGTPGPFALGEPARVRELLDGAGFEDVVVDEVTDERRYDSVAAWWEGVEEGSGGPIAAIVGQLAPPQRGEVRERAVAGAERFAGEGGEVVFPAALVVASAVRPG